MKTYLNYVHHVPGRLRVRATSVKGNASAALSVRARLSTASGITSSEVNTVTGSILVNYDVRLTNAAAICSILDNHHRCAKASSSAAPEVAAPASTHIHKPKAVVTVRTDRRDVQARAFEDASVKLLKFFLQKVLEQAIETAAKRAALLLIAMIL